MKLSAIRVLVAGVVAAGAFSSAFAQQEATGAGASFPAPLYSKWASDYNKATGVKINYQSVGSGAGLRQIEAKTVDFGALTPSEGRRPEQEGSGSVPHTVIGGVVPVVNIKGIAPGQIKLSGQVLGDIYLGKISNWSDPAIKALNPGVALPDASIAPVRRADGSGTSFIFTNYLSKVNASGSPKWVRHGCELAYRRRRQGQRRRGCICGSSAQLHWLCGVRIRQAEQDDLRADAKC